jgi:hypothetical protein
MNAPVNPGDIDAYRFVNVQFPVTLNALSDDLTVTLVWPCALPLARIAPSPVPCQNSTLAS